MTTKTDSSEKSGKKGLGVCLFAGCGGLLALLLAAGGIFLFAGWQGYQEAPKIIEGFQPGVHLQDPYTLSPAQTDLLISQGYPEAFTLLFYEEVAEDGSLQDIRLESWDYYSQGVGYTFINGELTGEDELDTTEIGQLAPMPYFPEQFGAYMSLDEVLAAAGLETYIEIPLEKEFLEDGDLFYGESLTFGLVAGELRYLEALALIEE